MRKFLSLLTTFLLFSGCVQSIALIGPASTAAGGGNLAQSLVSSAVSHGVKERTGKSPTEHAMSFIETKKPENKKEKCVDFLEATNSETCAAIKKSLNTKEKIFKKSKIENLASKSIQKRNR